MINCRRFRHNAMPPFTCFKFPGSISISTRGERNSRPLALLLAFLLTSSCQPLPSHSTLKSPEHILTSQPCGHLLTNTGVWSPDGEWIVYDVRSDAVGELFDGRHIEIVHTRTREIHRLYSSRNGAHCGVATFDPIHPRTVFILGPERPAPDWSYSPWHRQGVLVDLTHPGNAVQLDARDLTPPFTPGALRGGSHVHVFSADGSRVSFTYEDHVLATPPHGSPAGDGNQRNVGVSLLGRPVTVAKSHPRNHSGVAFSVLVTSTQPNPKPGSDEIQKAFEEGWIGTNGYRRFDGTHQRYALAFQGQVMTDGGQSIAEVFLVDLPDDLTRPGSAPVEGTSLRRPAPPVGTQQRRLTFTDRRTFPGIQGPRHWLRSSPDGSRIAFLMKDDSGVVQLWTVTPAGGPPVQLTQNSFDIASAFTWSPDGRWIAHVMDHSVCRTDTRTGRTERITARTPGSSSPRKEACVFSPEGHRIAFVRRLPRGEAAFNQICVVNVPDVGN